ncbi:MAG: nucleoside triphosphate pyrophosphohydrolase [Oscillospiraceae bacterium]|nr:nucleoside triphosphate pyrophosphohydrolase [Oscillospiraceae bacterium]
MVDFGSKPIYSVEDLRRIIDLLRSPGGCPWDAEQTHGSIRRNLLEEAYEAAEAIDTGDEALLKEELGDVLMQVVFHSDIEEKSGNFSLDDVSDGACRKLIRRHPHVFADAVARDSGEVLANWDVIKREEKQHTTTSDAMRSVAASLPALWRAEKVQDKAAKAGFDWPDLSGALEALREELGEFEAAVASEAGVEEELGDLLFSAVSAARFLNIDPEQALGAASDKFISRFSRVENAAREQGSSLGDLPQIEIENLYRQAKLEG